MRRPDIPTFLIALLAFSASLIFSDRSIVDMQMNDKYVSFHPRNILLAFAFIRMIEGFLYTMLDVAKKSPVKRARNIFLVLLAISLGWLTYELTSLALPRYYYSWTNLGAVQFGIVHVALVLLIMATHIAFAISILKAKPKAEATH